MLKKLHIKLLVAFYFRLEKLVGVRIIERKLAELGYSKTSRNRIIYAFRKALKNL